MIGRHSVHTALRAAAVGLDDGLTWQEIFEGSHRDMPNCVSWLCAARQARLILDDTYNASPESMLAALNLLDEMDGRKVAVLGDMLELGPYERQGHEMVGLRAAQVAKILLTLGRTRAYDRRCRAPGWHEKDCTFLNLKNSSRSWNG